MKQPYEDLKKFKSYKLVVYGYMFRYKLKPADL